VCGYAEPRGMQRVQEAAQRRGHGEHICRHEVREERHSLGMALGLTALGIVVIGVGGQPMRKARSGSWRPWAYRR
jgi:hypothetical protein